MTTIYINVFRTADPRELRIMLTDFDTWGTTATIDGDGIGRALFETTMPDRHMTDRIVGELDNFLGDVARVTSSHGAKLTLFLKSPGARDEALASFELWVRSTFRTKAVTLKFSSSR